MVIKYDDFFKKILFWGVSPSRFTIAMATATENGIFTNLLNP